jgi:acyl carrier protein
VTSETINGSDPGNNAGVDALRAARRELLERLTGFSPEDQVNYLVDLVVARAETARIEQNPDETFDDALNGDSPFFEVGFNSLSAVELRNQLVAATGLTLSPMLLFDYPTPGYVAEFLREELMTQAA